MLSYHHGDMRRYRGQPPGFWELYNGEREIGVTVQRLAAGARGPHQTLIDPAASNQVGRISAFSAAAPRSRAGTPPTISSASAATSVRT